MQSVIAALTLLAAYLLGAFPTGLVIVRAATGQDIRRVHSGRTGGTNAARAAGVWAGVATAVADVLKGAAAVWLARALSGGRPWVEAAAGLAAVLGHNYSVFLLERVQGRLRLRGGAGGAPTMGVAIALWPTSALVILPVALILLLIVGYASLATLSVGASSAVAFTWRAAAGLSPWAYAAYGACVFVALLIALRPNLQRLVQGQERRLRLKGLARPRAPGGEPRGQDPGPAAGAG